MRAIAAVKLNLLIAREKAKSSLGRALPRLLA
jgi:hypothetical protein